MILIRVSTSELSLLCFLAEKHLFKKQKFFLFGKILFLRIPLYAHQQQVNSYI